MTKKLYVGGLHHHVTGEILDNLFSAYGTVESATVTIDKITDLSRGHCQVSGGQAIPGRKSPGTPLISRHKSPLSSRRTLDHGEDDDELL